ncbi:DUF4258 domain-containing protein [Bdellovibrionota bacterium FG-1]
MMEGPKISRWVLSLHALERIQERKISAADLAEVIESPDLELPQGPKWILGKTFKHRDDNLVAAVLLERKEQELWVVLTVMVHFEKK